MDEPDPRGPRGVEPAATREQRAGVRLADLGDHERADDGRQDPEARLGEPEPRARLGDDHVGDGAQPHPAAERRAVDPGDDRHGTRVDGLEHVGHGHRVLLVALGVERHGRPHPGEVRTGAERRPVAGEDDRAELGRAFAGEQGERRPELADQARVEGVVDLGPAERDARNGVAGAGALDTQRLTHRAIVAGDLAARTGGYAAAMLLAIDHLVIAVDDPDDAATSPRGSGSG